jgi:RNA recognition motif-containing protein
MNSMYRIPNRIFVGGIPQSASQDELRDYFSHFGLVKDARIISDPRGNSRGYGFVTYESENDASKVLGLKEEDLMFKENRLNIGHAFRKKNFNNNGTNGNNFMSSNTNPMMHTAVAAAASHHHHAAHQNQHHHPSNNHNGSHHQMGLNHQSSLNGHSSMNGYLDPQMTNMHAMVGGGQGYGQANGLNLAGMNGHLGMSAGLNGHLGHMGGGMNGMNALSGMNMN